MSVSRKLYSCRFAPNGENPFHAIRVSQRALYRGEIVSEAFAPSAFAGTRASDVPILLDHDETERAGTVTVLVAHGDWHLADFLLDGPYASRAAEFIERSGKVSPGFTELDKDPISAREPCPMNWYTRARLDEISILPPGAIEWYQGAKVTRISELPKLEPKATRDEVIHHPPVKVRRDYATPITLRESDPSSWPVGEIVTHIGGGLVRTEGGQVLGRALRREGGDYVIDLPDGSQVVYSSRSEYLRDVGVR